MALHPDVRLLAMGTDRLYEFGVISPPWIVNLLMFLTFMLVWVYSDRVALQWLTCVRRKRWIGRAHDC